MLKGASGSFSGFTHLFTKPGKTAHTPFVVSNTEVRLRFFRGTLALSVVGHNKNYGTEQEYVNRVFDAGPACGPHGRDGEPGIEWLDYCPSTTVVLCPFLHITLTSITGPRDREPHSSRFLSGGFMAVAPHAFQQAPSNSLHKS